MKKSTTRGQVTTSTAGVVLPAQSTVALNKGTDKPFPRFITTEMIAAVSPILIKIDESLTQEKRTTRSIGLQLRQLKDGIADYIKKSGMSVSDKRIDGAFAYFVTVRFKIKNSRLNEYMRLAERTDLRDLDCSLSVSVLIELSRLDV